MSWAEFIESEYNQMTPLGEKYFVIGPYGSVQAIVIYGSFTDTEYNELYVIDSLQTVYPADTIISTTYTNL